MTAMTSATALPHNIPDFCASPTITSIGSGSWSNPSTWSPSRVPAVNDLVNVASGTTVTYDVVSDASLNCVAVNGRLSFRTDVSTRIKVGAFMVMAAGSLDVGTPAAPVAAGVNAEIVIANRPLNAAVDPEQFGTAFIGLGTIAMHGAVKTPTFSRLTVEPRAGNTTLTLEQAVTGWRAGDRLMLPDTRHLKWNEVTGWRITTPQWEEMTVKSISADGKVITLNSALAYDHLGARDMAGVLRFLPHVGNLTRNVIVRSEAPIGGAGVQGHAIFTDRAQVDIRYGLFRDLGRTVAEPTGPGNQIGRYPIHLHHLMGPATTPPNGYQYTLIGNAIDGGSTDHRRRWGIAIHNTHYGLVQDNVLYNYGGALVTTEDGSESYNVIDHNFALRSRGIGGRLGDGNEGQGFWFRGPNNYVRNNVAANFDNDEPEGSYGYKYFMRMLGTVNVPTAKGQDMSLYAARDGNAMPILEFTNNEVYGASQGGLTYWWVNSQDPAAAVNPIETLIKDFKVWHVYNTGIYHYPAARITFDGLTIIGKDPASSACCGRGFHGEDYAANNIRIINSDIEGMNIGVRSSTAGTGIQTVENSYLQNHTDVVMTTLYSANGGGWLPPRKVIVSNTRLAGSTAVDMDWDVRSGGQGNPTQLDQLLVYSYQNNPADNFRVYYNEQATQNVAGGLAPCTNHRAEISGIVCANAVAAPPVVTSIAPSTVSTAGGVIVTIKGSNFSGTTVTIGGAAATSVTRVDSTTLTAVAPPHAAGVVSVVATNSDGQSATLSNSFSYATCSFTVSPTSQTFASPGGTGSATLSAPAGCTWNATTGTSWITINSGNSGNASGSVGYTVASYSGTSTRSGSLTIGGKTLSVTQTACSFSLSSGSAAFNASSGTGSVNVTATAGCDWTVTNNASWITITSPPSATGSGAISYTVSANTGAARSASLTIAGQTYTVTQSAPVTTTTTMSLSPTALNFTATNNAGTLQPSTPGQAITLTQSGPGTVTWTATANQSWATVTPTSGSGAATLTVSINNAGAVLPASGSLQATVTVTTSGATNSPAATVNLDVRAPAQTTTIPFGAFDTPLNGASGLSGSIAVTGWALDDVAIDRVEIWRDRVPGETTPVFAGGGPGNGKIFIANPLFINGSRPDVQTAYPTSPFAHRAGWGYLLLTQGLWNQGNGTYTLYAFVYDRDGHSATLGTKTITVDNAHAAKPFGAIDTPGYGETVSGGFWNFGWALTANPNSTDPRGCTIANGNVFMAVDSGPLQAVNYGDTRTDIAQQFPAFSNGVGAGGAFYLDTTTLTNGTHQIGWLVTDGCGRTDGIGSRFFTVLNGSSSASTTTATAEQTAVTPASISAGASWTPIAVRRDEGEQTWVWPNARGTRVIAIEQDTRVAVQLPAVTGAPYVGYQLVSGMRRPLPVGSSLDAGANTFYWQPAAGFLGSFDLVFEAPGRGTAVLVRIVVGPPMRVMIDTPRGNATTSQPFMLAGWALDLSAANATGVDTVHVWAYPSGGGAPSFVGVAAYGDPRPDVAVTYAAQFEPSAYGLVVDKLPAGTYDFVVYAHSTASGTFSGTQTVRVNVQ
jgi:hypothetical protein